MIGDVAHVGELDLLVAAMVASCLLHAFRTRRVQLLAAGLLLGVTVEHASIRLGGTHCHASGAINVSECSSLNSVAYYIPWLYSCVVSAQQLCGDGPASKHLLPVVGGALFLGMCGVYELQGPMMGWWLWPTEDSVVKPEAKIWQLSPMNEDPRGMVVSEHAGAALSQRTWGVPALATYFHATFGWGILRVMQAFQFERPFASVLLGPLVALLWDPILRVARALVADATDVTLAPTIMGVTLLATLLTAPAIPTHTIPTDWLLFAAPALNQLYFATHALFRGGADVLAPDHKAVIAAISLVSTLAFARAAGVLTPWSKPSLATGKTAGWLDRLQKSAHDSELDPTNTRPIVFGLLAALQLPACWAIALWFEVPTVFAWMPIFSHVVGFIVGHYVIKTDKFFDMWGEATFFPLILHSYHTIPGASLATLQHSALTLFGTAGPAAATRVVTTEPGPSNRASLVTFLALVWCARLGMFLGWRILKRGSDWRFKKLMSGAAYNCFGWVSQGTWIFLQGACIWHLHAHADSTCNPAPTTSTRGGRWGAGQGTVTEDDPLSRLTTLDLIGACVFAVGLAVEVTADQQKSIWNSSTKSDGQAAWFAGGLWAYSRHPNYFGENLLWLGLAMISISGTHQQGSGAPIMPKSVVVAMVSPLWSTFFLVFTSMMLLEKRLDNKFKGRPAYEEYKKQTPVLLPRLFSS